MKKENENGKKKTGKALVILLILLAIVLAGVIAAFVLLNHFYEKTNYVEDDGVFETAPTEAEQFETLPGVDEDALSRKLEEERKLAIEKRKKDIKKTDDGEELISNKNVYNLLLIGVDRRDSTWNGNSDAMILASINYDEKKVVLTSFMRDTAVNIPGVGIRKMNAAFAVGNGPLLVQTMETNFAIDVDNYAWIDFEGMLQVIDTLGGVDLTLTKAEGDHIGVPVSGDSQVVHLDGQKALSYARDRTTGGSDFHRTARQRNVIMAIVNKAKSGGISNLTQAANTVLPYMTHNISEADLLSLILDLPKVVGFDFVQERVPIDGLYHNEGEFLVPDYQATIDRLIESIY